MIRPAAFILMAFVVIGCSKSEPSPSREEISAQAYHRSILLSDEGKYSEAEAVLTEALKEDPESTELLTQLATVKAARSGLKLIDYLPLVSLVVEAQKKERPLYLQSELFRKLKLQANLGDQGEVISSIELERLLKVLDSLLLLIESINAIPQLKSSQVLAIEESLRVFETHESLKFSKGSHYLEFLLRLTLFKYRLINDEYQLQSFEGESGLDYFRDDLSDMVESLKKAGVNSPELKRIQTELDQVWDRIEAFLKEIDLELKDLLAS